MFIFQSRYRSHDLNFGKKTLTFTNFVLKTEDKKTADYLRKVAEANPHDVWELEKQAEVPPAVQMSRGARAVEQT